MSIVAQCGSASRLVHEPPVHKLQQAV